jgi:hypothetical protein
MPAEAGASQWQGEGLLQNDESCRLSSPEESEKAGGFGPITSAFLTGASDRESIRQHPDVTKSTDP